MTTACGGRAPRRSPRGHRVRSSPHTWVASANPVRAQHQPAHVSGAGEHRGDLAAAEVDATDRLTPAPLIDIPNVASERDRAGCSSIQHLGGRGRDAKQDRPRRPGGVTAIGDEHVGGAAAVETLHGPGGVCGGLTGKGPLPQKVEPGELAQSQPGRPRVIPNDLEESSAAGADRQLGRLAGPEPVGEGAGVPIQGEQARLPEVSPHHQGGGGGGRRGRAAAPPPPVACQARAVHITLTASSHGADRARLRPPHLGRPRTRSWSQMPRCGPRRAGRYHP